MELREIKKQLWNSVDAQFQRRTLGAGIAILCLFGVSCGILFQLASDEAMFMIIAGCVVTLPLLAWRLWRLLRIFRKAEQYIFFRTTLSAPKGNSKLVAFPVKVPGGERRWTDRIFYIRNLQPLLSDWLDETVTVAWNRETDMVVVIGR